MAQCRYNLAERWHLLSLDAPTVAGLWSWFFAHAMLLHPSAFATLFLSLGTWLLYVWDRILDGLHDPRIEPLRDRHVFHACHRKAFLVASMILIVFSGAVFLCLRAEVLRDDVFLAIFTLLYFFAVHFRRGRARPRTPWLPKELAVGVLFAAAAAVPAWSRLAASAGGRVQLAPAVIFFGVLCWINCVGIEKWEANWKDSLPPELPHCSTRWAGIHLRPIAAVLALASLSAAILAPSRGLMEVYLAALLSSGILLTLDTRRFNLSPLHLRIAADVALLTPLAFLPMSR